MQAYRSLHSYKQRYIHKNQYNETCIEKKNQYLVHIRFGHGPLRIWIRPNINFTFHALLFCIFSRAPLLQTLQHYYISIYLYANSRNPYDGDERNVVAWWSKSPLRRKRKIDGLGWTGPRASGLAFGIIISCQRAWGVEHQRGGGGVGIGFRSDLWNFGNHVFLEGIDLVWTT